MMATFLLLSYMNGEISLLIIVRIAQLALLDSGSHIDLEMIAGLGHGVEAAISTIRLPVKLSGILDWIDFDMIYPHAFFAKLYETNYAEFGRRFFGGAMHKIRDFWDSQVDHPSYASHPLRWHEFDHKDYACPLFIHGDDVASIGLGKIWSKAINVLSFGGVLSHGCAPDESHGDRRLGVFDSRSQSATLHATWSPCTVDAIYQKRRRARRCRETAALVYNAGVVEAAVYPTRADGPAQRYRRIRVRGCRYASRDANPTEHDIG